METVVIVVTAHNRKRQEKGLDRWRANLHKRLARLNVQAVAWYVLLTDVGILLYRLGAAYALQQRGYYAVGGEALALLLPVFYYCAAETIRDIVRDAVDRRNKQ